VHKGTEGEGAAPTGPGPQLPGSLKTQPMLDGWIRIGPDGTATLFTGKAESAKASRRRSSRSLPKSSYADAVIA